jgi:hypothetical protein
VEVAIRPLATWGGSSYGGGNLGGNKEEAIAWLQKGYAQHSNVLTTLKVEPGFDPLRSDARFQELLQPVGLAQ